MATPGVEYRCPMHPQIIRDAPGSCPICGMALEPVLPSEAHSQELADFTRRMLISAAASIPLIALTMDDFDFTDTPDNTGLVRDLAAGTFVADQRNVVLVGGTGTGKSHLAIAIARALIRNGACGRLLFHPISKL